MHDAEISRKLAWPFNSGPYGGLKIRGEGIMIQWALNAPLIEIGFINQKLAPVPPFPPALQYPAPEESSIIFCVLFLNFHILRALSFDRQSLTQVYLFSFLICFIPNLSFQKFVKALTVDVTHNKYLAHRIKQPIPKCKSKFSRTF